MVHDVGRSWCFDDERAVANAGVMLPALLAARLGIEALVDAARGSRRPAGRGESGAQGDDAGLARWRSGRTASRTATCCARGRPRRCSGTGSRRRRRWGRSCARSRSGMSASSTACSAESARAGVGGRRRTGRRSGWSSMSTRSSARSTATTSRAPAFGYTRKRGYHPILATRADTGEVLHIRAAQGLGEHRARRAAVRRRAHRPRRARRRDRPEAAARRLGVLEQEDHGPPADARAGATRSASASSQHVTAAIAAIPESDWQPLDDYPDDGEAQIAETMLGGQRLIVRRTRLLGAAGRAWPDWRHFAFITNRTDALDARRGRAPPARRRRARDPRPQRPGARALPLRQASTPTPPGR